MLDNSIRRYTVEPVEGRTGRVHLEVMHIIGRVEVARIKLVLRIGLSQIIGNASVTTDTEIQIPPTRERGLGNQLSLQSFLSFILIIRTVIGKELGRLMQVAVQVLGEDMLTCLTVAFIYFVLEKKCNSIYLSGSADATYWRI
jgi:hypothetical protein